TAESAVARRPAIVPELGLSLEEPVTRAEYESLIRPLVERSGEAVLLALDRAKLAKDKIDRVLLVGGMSKTPLVRKHVEKLLGKPPEPAGRVDPLTCVAEGAAIVSALLQGAPGLEAHAYTVKLEHSLSACPVDERG